MPVAPVAALLLGRTGGVEVVQQPGYPLAPRADLADHGRVSGRRRIICSAAASTRATARAVSSTACASHSGAAPVELSWATAWLTLPPKRRTCARAAISSTSASRLADGTGPTVPRAAASATAPT